MKKCWKESVDEVIDTLLALSKTGYKLTPGELTVVTLAAAEKLAEVLYGDLECPLEEEE